LARLHGRRGEPTYAPLVLHGLAVFFGLTNPSGHAYSFWSGIGADLGEATIITGMLALYRKHNCHARGCWRIGKLGVDGTPYVVCHRHHPAHHGTRKATAEEIQRLHAASTSTP